MDTAQQDFLDEVEAFIKEHDMDATSFGKASIGNANFVFRLRNGTSPTLRTVDKARRYMVSIK